MKCVMCGADFRPSGHGVQKYCSAKCRNRAKVAARKARKAGVAPPAPSEQPKPVAEAEPPDLTLADFQRMMDASVVDVLRHNMAILQKRLERPDVSDNAMASLNREIRAMAVEIEKRDHAAGDLLAGLHDAAATTGTKTEAAHGGWQEAI